MTTGLLTATQLDELAEFSSRGHQSGQIPDWAHRWAQTYAADQPGLAVPADPDASRAYPLVLHGILGEARRLVTLAESLGAVVVAPADLSITDITAAAEFSEVLMTATATLERASALVARHGTAVNRA